MSDLDISMLTRNLNRTGSQFLRRKYVKQSTFLLNPPGSLNIRLIISRAAILDFVKELINAEATLSSP